MPDSAPPLAFAPYSAGATGTYGAPGILSSLFSFLPTAANVGLSFFQEDNRNREALRSIDAQRDILLAQYGAAVPGRVGFPTVQAAVPAYTAPSIPNVSFGGIGGSLGGYAPLLLGGALLLVLLRR